MTVNALDLILYSNILFLQIFLNKVIYIYVYTHVFSHFSTRFLIQVITSFLIALKSMDLVIAVGEVQDGGNYMRASVISPITEIIHLVSDTLDI